MDLASCQPLVGDLEADPSRVPAYYGELEAAILWLMDTTFESMDPAEKARLATTEMRARLVLKRFGKQDTN